MTSPAIADYYPLSSMQEGILFHSLFAPGQGLYCDQVSYAIHGAIDVDLFGRAWQLAADRNPALRTSFVWEGVKEAIQVVHERVEVPLSVLDWRSVETGVQQDQLAAHLVAERERGFDLSKPPLLRLWLIRLTDQVHHFVWTWHHLLLDGWSIPLVANEVFECYAALRVGQEPPVQERLPYKRYIKWLRQRDLGDAETFWRREFEGFSGATALGTDRAGADRSGGLAAYGCQTSTLSPALTTAVSALARRHRVTLNIVLQGVWALLLSKRSGDQSVVFGVTVAGRPTTLEGSQSIRGVCINTLPLRTTVNPSDDLGTWLGGLQKRLSELLRYESSPLIRIQEWCGQRHSLFESLFIFENFPLEEIDRGLDFTVGPARYETRTNYPLTLLVMPAAQMTIRFMYERGQFDDTTITRLRGHYEALLEAMVRSPQLPLGELTMLTSDERQQLVVDWNTTTADYPGEQTVAQLFEAQMARAPSAVAVAQVDRTLTYAQVNSQANVLARRLRREGVAAGVLVGVCLERSPEMLVGLLGILKAGGAYVPLDPAFPADRLAFMLADSAAPFLLTETRLQDLVARDGVTTICLDTLNLAARGADDSNLGSVTMPDDLAYVLYTSGSTGKPKGVEISHRALTNFLWAMKHEPGFTADDVLLAVTTLSFDIAGLELYLPLVAGGRVELVSRTVAADGRRLREAIERTKPTVLQATPSTWRMLIESGWNGTPGLKSLIGGEPLPPDLVQPLLDRTTSVWNMYGPTETTIWSSVQQVTSASDEITVGRPIANTTFYILDAQRQPVPIGVAGELYIGGDGLARGYRGRPELTAEKFVADPFSAEPGGCLYRTGDLARYRADGRVVHLGRLDHQVKIRGFRIELGEIEAALGGHPGVKQAVVVAREDQPGAAMLVGYWVAVSDPPVTTAELRQHLRQTLPDYMVPQQFVRLEVLPLTPNGKIDRKRLPAPTPVAPDVVTMVAPRTPVEEQVAAVFADVLQVPSLSVLADFFELGGQSLLAIRLMSRLEAAFKIELPLQLLFERPTVASLSDRICELTGRVPTADEAVVDTPKPPREARTVTQRKLSQIWADLLDRPVVSIDESFLDLQGGARLVEQMLADVKKTFGVFAEGMSLPAFEARPTIAFLAELIDEGIHPPSALVVPLQPRGNRAPLFLIHAGGGYVFFYRALAMRLEPDQPVYGVRAVTDSDPGRPFHRSRSVEALAAQYIAEIRTIQSRGPYNLGGACFGGVIAFEMARQLEQGGETLGSPVLLFDSYIDDPSQGAAGYQAHSEREYAMKRAAAHFTRSVRLSRWAAARYLFGKVIRNLSEVVWLVPAAATAAMKRAASWRMPEAWRWKIARLRGEQIPLERLQQHTMEQFLKATFRLLRTYRPAPRSGGVVLFRAAAGVDPAPGWRPYVPSNLMLHDLPGVHLDMMEEPAVVDTAELVTRYLHTVASPAAAHAPDQPAVEVTAR